jgi:glycogen(starch) synthase
MHLALVTPEWYADTAGGIATYCRVLAHTAANAGHEVTVFAATRTPSKRGEVTGRLRVLPVLVPRHGAMAAAERFRDAWSSTAGWTDPPDCIEAAEFGGSAALIAETASAPPLTSRLHTPLALLLACNRGERVYPDDEDRCSLERRQVLASALATSPSRWLALEAAALWDLRPVPEVIPNPLCTGWLTASATPGPRDSPARVLYVGRLEYRKGVLTLAAAVRRVLDANIRMEVIFVGGDTVWQGGPMSVRVRELLGTSAGYTLLPPVGQTELRCLLDEVDVVVLPSNYENFSYACLEAMARSKPVIATSGSGFDEIIDDGRTGFLVPPEDPDALAGELKRLLGEEDLRRAAGAAAHAAVRRFRASAVVPRLLDRYAAMSGQAC